MHETFNNILSVDNLERLPKCQKFYSSIFFLKKIFFFKELDGFFLFWKHVLIGTRIKAPSKDNRCIFVKIEIRNKVFLNTF